VVGARLTPLGRTLHVLEFLPATCHPSHAIDVGQILRRQRCSISFGVGVSDVPVRDLPLRSRAHNPSQQTRAARLHCGLDEPGSATWWWSARGPVLPRRSTGLGGLDVLVLESTAPAASRSRSRIDNYLASRTGSRAGPRARAYNQAESSALTRDRSHRDTPGL